MASTTYYQILEVSKTATEKEIKSAYKRLTIQWHPDKHGGSPEAVAKMQDINKAYATLSNAEMRAEYDTSLNPARSTQRSPNPPTSSGSSNSRGTTTGPRTGGVTGTGFDDAFSGMMGGLFGGANRVRAGARPPSSSAPGSTSGATATRGESAASSGDDVKIEITLEEAFHGSERKITVNAEAPCPDCNGTGNSQKGRNGLQMGTICPTCRGAGRKKRMEEVPVTVRPGVYEGAKLLVKGKGPLDAHGKPTNVRLIVHIKKHATFTLEESNLSMDLPVPYTVLVLGGDVQVPTLAGNRPLSIPAGTKPMQKLRLPGLGLPALGERPTGDLFARIQVAIPTSVSAEERKLLTDLARLRNDPIKG